MDYSQRLSTKTRDTAKVAGVNLFALTDLVHKYYSWRVWFRFLVKLSEICKLYKLEPFKPKKARLYSWFLTSKRFDLNH